MFVLALRVDLRLPACHSLKEKRALLRPIVEGARSRFSVSVAEVDHQDSWQRAELGFALVSGSVTAVEELATKIERFIWQADEIEVLDIERLWLDDPSA